MKRWLLVILITLSLCTIGVYYFIPSVVRISDSISINSSSQAMLRMSRNPLIWKKVSGGYLKAGQPLLNGTNISLAAGQDTPVIGKIIIVPLRADSSIVIWDLQMSEADGVGGRIKHYARAVGIKARMNGVMEDFRKYCLKTENLYGINILQKSTVDTFLVSTKFRTDHSPTNDDIYNHVDLLKKYISTAGGEVKGDPMLNITMVDSASYKCMVALPVNKILPGEGDIFFVRMVPGSFLTSDVRGGPKTIEHAQDMMQLYFQEFNRTAMAVPFEYMVTDRRQQKDTSQWVTRLYAPVM